MNVAAKGMPNLMRTIDRRAFLEASTACVVGIITTEQVEAAETEFVPALDAHTHFYDPTRSQGVPWPGKQDKVLYRAVLPAEFQELTSKLRVQSTIVVEASPWVEDNQWLLELAEKNPVIVGIVGHLDPVSDEFAKHCERFAANKLFRGIRVNHANLRRGLEQPAFLDNLRLLVKHDLQLDVNGGPDMPNDVAKLAQLMPDLRIVINHEANLTIDGKTPQAEWRKGMEVSAAGKQVWCKVSALAEGTRRKEGHAPDDVDFYRPVLDALWEIFGEDRLIYGSNWPVSVRAASYATVHSIVNRYFHEKGKHAAEKYFLRNAQRAYKPIDRST